MRPTPRVVHSLDSPVMISTPRVRHTAARYVPSTDDLSAQLSMPSMRLSPKAVVLVSTPRVSHHSSEALDVRSMLRNTVLFRWSRAVRGVSASLRAAPAHFFA